MLIFDDVPNQLGIDAEIVVNQYMPHADDVGPGNLWNALARFLGPRPSGLADDLQVADTLTLDELILFKNVGERVWRWMFSIASRMSRSLSHGSLTRELPRREHGHGTWA